jgi:hypothetical protein
MKPYTVSDNLICPDFTNGRDAERSLSALEVVDILSAGGTVVMRPINSRPLDAYEQLESEQPGELLYISKGLVEPPSDIEH